MNQLPPPSKPISDLIKCMDKGLKWVPNVDEIADLLWLSLQVSKYVTNSEMELSQVDSFQEIAEKIDASEDQLDGTFNSLEKIDISTEQSVNISDIDERQQVPLGTEPAQKVGTESKRSSLPIAVPAASALPKALRLSRSLRPLLRKEKSFKRQELDLDATIVQIADEKLWSPVTQPASERWLELAIVVEETNLLEVWQDTIVEFQHLMERHGAFRDVKAWQLVRCPGDAVQLFRRKGFLVDRTHSRNPRELHDPRGRRMIILVSDCTSIGWRSGQIPILLYSWMTKNPVTVLQLLPERYWERSILGLGYSVWLRSTLPGELNHRLIVEGLPNQHKSFWSKQVSEETESEAVPVPSLKLTLPIITLEPSPLSRWAKVVAGNGEQVTAGIVLDLSDLIEYEQEVQQTQDLLTAEQLVRRFRGTASPIARQLAVMMAAVPVSWFIIRLIQKNLLPNKADTVHIAEIFLSGLLKRVFQASETQKQKTVKIHYDFVEDVRELLIGSVSRSATERVIEHVGDQMFDLLPKEVQRRLSEDIGRRIGRSIRRFEAFLLPELLVDLELDKEMRTELLSFASIARQILSQLGGEYSHLVETLDRRGLDSYKANGKQAIQHQTLFPDDLGETLKRKVAEAYRPRQLLQRPDANAKIIQVDGLDNRIQCIYTGYFIVLDETNRLAAKGFEQGINFDTICPHSKRSGEFSGDMHHIFPAKAKVNSARGALPFAKLADAEVLEWFREDVQMTTIPTDRKDEYSRKGSNGFEPRDQAKGKVARALFYVYTIYEGQADPSFFEEQKAVLRQWHSNYPPTQEELIRSQKIAESEQGNANPFVVDPTLVERIFFAEPETEWQPFGFNIATIILLSTVEVEVAQIEQLLIPFEFQVATLFLDSTKKKPSYDVNRTTAIAYQWVENLGNNITLEMVSIPAGRFEMGAPKTEAESVENERPQHPVEIHQPFWMGKYLVTQAQWQAVAKLPQVSRKLKVNPSRFKGADRPVECVSWLDAVEFCQRLSIHTGRDYQLPSEAEWEYACRAGTTTPFHFGETIATQVANYDGTQTYANGPTGTYRQETTSVGSFGVANAFGLYDMHGNVWEWCEDDWHGSYEGAPTDGRPWIETNREATYRLVRGGSWYNYPRDCRSACRNNVNAGDENDDIGFRVVCSVA